MNDKKIVLKILNHIKNSYKNLDRKRYRQEPAYITALMAKLEGNIFDDGTGKSVQFKITMVDDHGRNAAEKEYGADFAIVLEKRNCNSEISKAILGQGKNGSVDELTNAEKERLVDQCRKMELRTSEFIVLEAPKDNSTPPMVRIGDTNQPSKMGIRLTLEDYLLKQFFACKHGDKRDEFVHAVQDSKLSQLKVITRGLDLDLTLNPEPEGPSL